MFEYFYHERIRKSVAMFGKLFNDIYVIRKNSTGASISQIKVPLTYAPKQKFLERIRENPDLYNDTKVAIKLPRMSFEIISIAYDPARQLPKSNNINRTGSTNDVRSKIYSYVPYNIGFQLSIYAKNQDDALQVVEQIIPFFSPQYTLTIKPLADFPDVKEDVPVTLTGVTFTDDYEGMVEQRRTIIYTLDFDMKVNFYGPINESNIIRKSIVNFYNMKRGELDSDRLFQTLTVEPDPINVSPDSDYGFTETWTSILDSA